MLRRPMEGATYTMSRPSTPIPPRQWRCFVFFFQAEDGIRDLTVTGVQTCALPIFFAAPDAVPRAEGLRQLGEALARHRGLPGTVRFDGWDQALDALLGLATSSALPVVLDEFPYLARSTPELPSLLQRALSPRRPERRGSRCRLLLCGSAVLFMGKLLSGSAPLRGRAGLELVVPTFDFRQAADFWGVRDSKLAMQLHSVVGGTPAYRT